MYGFKSRETAVKLSSLAAGMGQVGPPPSSTLNHIPSQVVMIYSTPDVAEVDNLAGMDQKICHGRYHSKWMFNDVNKKPAPMTGIEYIHYCEAIPIQMKHWDKTEDPATRTDEQKVGKTFTKPSQQKTFDELSVVGSPADNFDYEDTISNIDADTEKIEVYNLSLCPLLAGQWVTVSFINGRWCYCGSHNFFATVATYSEVNPDTAQTEIASESYGGVYINSWARTWGTTTTFDRSDETVVNFTAGCFARIFNPWSEPIASGTRVLCTDIGGVCGIIGWEC